MFVARLAVPVLLVSALACNSDELGGPVPPDNRTRILLTDAPFPFDLVTRVDVHIVSVDASESADTTNIEWINVTTPDATFNLLEVQRGATTIVGDGDLPAGQYRAVRMVIDTDRSSITLKDGSQATVRWPLAGTLALHALVEEPLAVDPNGANIVIDFDVGRSFFYGGVPGDSATAGSDFIFIPWIRAVNDAATGGITGTVFGTDIEGNPFPLADATVSILRGNPASGPLTWWTVATGATDAQGTYRIDFLLAGDYIVRATPPSDVRLGPATLLGVTVSVGAETDQNLTLTNASPTSLSIVGPPAVDIGQEIQLRAVVLDQNGDTLSGQAVSWLAGPTGVASIRDPNGGVPTGELANLRGESPGRASVVASSFDLFDSVTVTVRNPNAAPVATVELSPATQTVSVFDSLSIGVTLRDAQGNAVVGTNVTWLVGDSTALAIISPPDQFVTTTPAWAHFLALSAGSVTVTATSEGRSESATVVIQ